MDLARIAEALQHDAASVVFVNVLLQQLGLPLPVVPTLLLAGSLAEGGDRLAVVLLAAVSASVIADWIWYWLGRRFGYRIMTLLCQLSINPSSCVSQTEARFLRWGIWSLLVAKFVPGFSTVAPPIAGALRMRQGGFLAAAAGGAAIWAGTALVGGWLLRDSVHAAIRALDAHTSEVALVFASLVAVWLGWKFWKKFKFSQLRAIPHITAGELIAALSSPQPPLLLDFRGAALAAQDGPIVGATPAEHDFLYDAVGDWPKERPIVTLCACPEDAGAIQAARRLIADGYLSVRPLRGGYQAWLTATAGAAVVG